MWRGRSVDGVAPDPYLKLKRGTNIWNDVSNNEWDRITVARSGSTRERREESGARSIDRSIDSFELEHEATTRNRAEGGFLDRDWFCFSLSIGHINHIANDAALLFIYSLSLSSSAFSYQISVSPVFVPPRYSVVSLRRLHRRRDRLYRSTTRCRGGDRLSSKWKALMIYSTFNFLLFLHFNDFSLFDKIRWIKLNFRPMIPRTK